MLEVTHNLYPIPLPCRFEVEELNWDVATVLAMNRDHFGPKGPLEVMSERLIREASLGNLQNVQSILRDGKVHPNVGDVSGHTALIAATVGLNDTLIWFIKNMVLVIVQCDLKVTTCRLMDYANFYIHKIWSHIPYFQ